MRLCPRVILACALSVVLGSPLCAEDFRIETEVYARSKGEADVRYLTIFTSDATYDFRLTEPQETVIYEPGLHRITLLSPSRKLRTGIQQSDLIEFTAALKAKVSESRPLFYFACNPQFKVETDDSAQTVSLSSPLLSYRIQAESPKASYTDAVNRYQEFADWSARLSAMRAGALHLPPFARIEANQIVARKGWIPSEVERTVTVGSKKQESRTKHVVNWIVSDQDQKRMSRAGDDLVTFRSVPYVEYAQDDTQVAKKETR
jgi:hypothetical protein